MKTIIPSILICWCLLSAPFAVAQQASSAQPKSASKALTWAVGATVIPAAVGGAMILHSTEGMGTNANEAGMGILLGTLGFLFGPGTGHAYAGREHPMKGAWLRAGGLLVGGIGGLGAAVSESFGNDQSTGTIVLVVAGGVMILVSTVHDIATTGRSVEEYNREHGLSGVQLQPWYHRSKQAAGLAVTFNL